MLEKKISNIQIRYLIEVEIIYVESVFLLNNVF